ncbi:MAG: hypothetical protein IKO00_03590 [Oscillospiraceae bacterium]|nr:hypothetical protein [Oscillospiraceae bacterium]
MANGQFTATGAMKAIKAVQGVSTEKQLTPATSKQEAITQKIQNDAGNRATEERVQEEQVKSGLQLGQWKADPDNPGTMTRKLVNRNLTGQRDSGTETEAGKRSASYLTRGEQDSGGNITRSGGSGSRDMIGADALRQRVQELDNQDKTYWTEWDWMDYWQKQADLKNAEQPEKIESSQPAAKIQAPAIDRSGSWSTTAANMQSFQNLGKEMDRAEFAGDVSPQMESEYLRQAEKYFARPAQYTAENIGDYMDRAYYLSLKAGLTENEKAEAQEILDIIQPKSPLVRLFTDKGDYYQNLFKTDRQEAWSLSMIAENLENRMREENGTQALGYGFTRGSGLGPVQDAIGAKAAERVRAGSTDNVDLMMAQQTQGLKLGEAYAQKENPALYGAGNFAGTMVLLGGLGEMVGAPVAAAVNGSSGIAKLAGLGKAGKVFAKYLPGMIGSGTTFGSMEAVQNVGRLAGGEISGREYAREIATGIGAGAAGSALSQKVTAAGLKFLRGKSVPTGQFYDTGEEIFRTLADNRMARAVLDGFAGVAFVGGDQGLREISNKLQYGKDYHTDWGSFLESGAVSFAFAMLHSWARNPAQRETGWTEGQNGASAAEENARGREYAEKYFKGCSTPEEYRTRFRELAKQYHSGEAQQSAEMQNIMAEVLEGKKWLSSNGMFRAAQAGEEARAAKESAEARGDAKAAAKADAEMRDAIRLLNEYAADPDIAPTLGRDAQEALEILNAVTSEEAGTAAEVPAPGQQESNTEFTGLQLGAQQEGAENETVQQETVPAESEILGQEKDRSGAGEQAGGIRTPDIIGAGADTGTQAAVSEGQAAADGGERRIAGERAAGQTGGLDEGAEPGRGTGGTDRAGRNAAGKSLGDAVRESEVKAVSTKQFGIENGTDSETVYPVPEEMLPDDLRSRIYGAELASGCSIEFFAGPLEFVGDDGTVYHADGYIDLENMRIAVQVDGDYEPWQILAHEEFHAESERDEWLVARIRDSVLERYGRQELAEIVKGYIRKLRGLRNIESGPMDLLSKDAEQILEEIFADASGMMNKFSLGAQKYFGQVATELNNRTLSGRDSAAREKEDTPRFQKGSAQSAGSLREMSAKGSIADAQEESKRKFSVADDGGQNSRVSEYKAGQLQALEESGNVPEEYADWFSDPEDIYTYAEALDDPAYDHEQYRRDFTRTQAGYALKDGSITVYSAGELRPGAFVTPSRMEALNHADGEELQSTNVPLEQVAWMSPFAGLYTGENPVANINNAEYNNYTPYDQPHWSADETALEEHHWPENFPQVMFQTTTSALKNSKNVELHAKAKKGDRDAADQLVQKLSKPERLQAFAEQYKDALVVPIRGEGAGSKNQIPYAYAAALKVDYGMKLDEQIIQVQKAGHTDAEGIHRLMAHSVFDGEVIQGQDYVLVDDVMTFGGTLNDLRDYIESNGGRVVACTVLAVGRNGSYLAVQPKTVEEIYSKFGKEEINNLLREAGIAYDAESLTDRQARYIQNTDLFTLRNRIDAEKASGGYRGGVSYTPREPGERSAKEILEERAASGRPQRKRRVFFSVSDEEPSPFDDEPATRNGIRGARYGSTGYTLNNNDRVGITYAFVPMESLTVSNATDGSINPDYPQELQPRDRTRSESLRQIIDMANNLTPERLEKNADVQGGAPLVRSDGVVIAGNGRSMSLRLAYDQGKADRYVQYLKDHAGEWGLSPEDMPEDMPMLVRIADEGQDWEQLARDSNVSTVAAQSDSEQARTDAKNLRQHPEVLDKLIPDEDGNLNTAANRAFISDFINKVVPGAERGELRTDDGLLSQHGLKRVQHAIFEMAYGDASLLEKLSERLDNDMKNVTNALLAAAPQVVAYENAVDKGDRYDIGLRQFIKDAVELYRSTKEKGETVAQRTANLGFDEEVNDRIIYVARFIERNKGSGKQLREFFGDICESADELGDPNQTGFFEDDTEDKNIEAALRGAIRKYEDATGRQLPKVERWGAGTLEELQDTTGLSGKQLEDYYLRDERGMGAQHDGRNEGEYQEETGRSDAEGLTPGDGEDGREGSDLGRERDGGRGSGSGRDDGGRIPDVVEGPLEEEPASEKTDGLKLGAAEEPTGAERILERRRKDKRTAERNRERNKHQRTQFPDYNEVPEDAGRDFREIAEEIRSRAAEERAARLEHVSKDKFFGTESLQKLGVRIEGALGNYRNTKQLREIERAAYQLKRTIRKREKELNATAKEKQMANGLAAGIYTMEDFGPNVNKAKIEELADYYSIERTINEDMILERRRQITGQLAEMMREMLPNDPGYKIPPMFVLNHRTPERICRQIFGDDKGKEVYDRIFRPVAVNEAEKIRFIGKQFKDVREIQGRNGQKSELTKEERMLVQQMIEGQAAAELVAGMELEDGRERIENAAQNILNGTAAGDAANEHGLDEYERGVAEQYARWLQTKAIYDSGDFDTVKVDNAVRIYKEKFNLFYDAINDFLVAHGYKPIGFIRGYAPHMQMQEDLNVFAGYLKSLGINEDVTRLPANIAGQTAGYKPNKRWNPFFLTRSGNTGDFDIAKGFQSYVTYMADVLFHTDDIMRLRAMSRHYKETYAPEEIKENLGWARNMNSAAPQVKREQLQARGILSRDEAVSDEEANERFDKWIEEQFDSIENTTKYSDLVMYLDNYANILAGKQSMSDRGGEYDWGRESLTRANRLVSAFARTQVAGNLSSAVSQFSQIPMISAELGVKYVLQAIRDFASGKLRKAGWAQESDHLTERAGSGALVTDGFEMWMERLFSPLRMIDGFTATIAVRAKYLQQIEQGKSHEEAMREADAYAKRVQGSRAKGSKPLAFHSKKLVNQMLHMFQLELFNSWEHVSQDIPADFREIERTQGKSKASMALALVILKYLIAAFLLNRTTEELTGGTPAPFDLLGLASNFIASGYGLTTNRYLMTAIDNAMEKMWDKRIFETDQDRMREEFNWKDAMSGAGYELGSDIPYLRNILGLLGLGDQTLPLPLMGAGDDLKYLWKDINNDIENRHPSGQTGMDLFRVINQLYPGGRQVTKTAEGIQVMAQGGRYVNGQLYYPVENTIGNWAKALLFGRSALEETDAFYAGDDRKLSLGATELYQMLTDQGSAERREAYETLQGARSLNEDQTEFLQKYADGGGDPWELWQTMQQYKEAANDKTLGSYEKGKQTRAAITAADLTDEERLALYRVMDKDNKGKADKMEAIMDSGLSWANAVKAYDAYAGIEANEGLSKKEQAEQWASWVNHQNFTEEQKTEIRDSIKFWGSYAIEDTSVDKLSGAGLDADNADIVAELLNSLEPEPGRDKVTDLQKYSAIAGSSLDVNEQWKAIIGITPESYTSTLDKITIMQDMGITPAVWTESKQAMYDADDAGNDNDSTDQTEAKQALDSMDIPDEQKAILWQLTNKSWSWKKNPYDTDIGQEVYALMHEGDTGSSSTTKKKSGGGGRRGGGGGGRRSGAPAAGLVLGEAVDTGHRGIYNQILIGWRKRKYSRAQILAMVRAGKLTQEEADEILATKQEAEEETDGSLVLGG